MNGQKAGQVDFAQIEKQVTKWASFITRPIRELYDGILSKTLPWHLCCGAGIVIQLAISLHLDRRLFKAFSASILYPSSHRSFQVYYLVCMSSPFVVWALYKSILKQRFLSKLTMTFQQIGLKNGMGKLPNFVFDKPIDSQTRKLRLSRVGISPIEFEKKKEDLASALHVYVDEVRENRSKGTVDFIYGTAPMPKDFIPEEYRYLGPNKFLVGTTRSKQYIADLRDTPHVLVAGQTGGGKSTFLRQFISTLYLNNSSYEFALIDLKGGLEFQTFEKLPRVTVIGDVAKAAFMLKEMAEEIQFRMAFLKQNQCKDIVQFFAKPKEERIGLVQGGESRLNRKIIVVDEAAELFLAGGNAASGDVQSARRILSQIARQGRSLGIHLVLATQRPDSRALDPQIKANLPGVLCFQMVNDVSSISVLGTGRATDLPPIPGRGIWKNGLDTVEVQTPYMNLEKAESYLKPLQTEQDESTLEMAQNQNSKNQAEPTLTKSSRPKDGHDGK